MLDRRTALKTLCSLSALTAARAIEGSGVEPIAKTAVLVQTSPVAGFQFYSGEDAWSEIAVGDSLLLQRQPDNEYDENAIEVYWRDLKLGYVPRAENRVVSQMMDRGCRFTAAIASKTWSSDPWQRLAMDISLLV